MSFINLIQIQKFREIPFVLQFFFCTTKKFTREKYKQSFRDDSYIYYYRMGLFSSNIEFNAFVCFIRGLRLHYPKNRTQKTYNWFLFWFTTRNFVVIEKISFYLFNSVSKISWKWITFEWLAIEDNNNCDWQQIIH